MAIFTPKTTCLLVTGGSCATGGGAMYYHQMPKTWKELFVKEGRILLSKDDEFKAVYYDQKDKDFWEQESELKGKNTSSEAQSALTTYCKSKLGEKMPWFKRGSTTKDKLLSLCTSEGIVTVKGKITQSGKDNWIDASKEDDKYKTIFAVYKYNDQFLTWLKKDNETENNSLTSESKASDSYDKLKKACEKLLKRPHAEVKESNSKLFDQAYWWCTPLGYDTIEGRIKEVDKNWTALDTKTGDWNSKLTTWRNTDDVKKLANKESGQGEGESQDLTENSLKTLCGDTNLKKKLYDDDAYQNTYKVIKAVCKNESQDAT